WEHDDPNHHAPAHYGVRTRRYKYIHYYGDGLGARGSSDRIFAQEFELYDLASDPQALANRADGPEDASALGQLREALARLQGRYQDLPYQRPDTPRPDWSSVM